MESISASQAFGWEFFGTTMLILLGSGVCAAVNLRTSGAKNAGWLGISFGWGFAVFVGASIADVTGGHLNPAVTLTLAIADKLDWSLVPAYMAGQILGAIVGAILAWAAFKQLYDANGVDENGNPTTANEATGGNFYTAPAHPNNFWNCVTEFIATFVLLSFVMFGPAGGELGPLTYFGVSVVIVAIGLSLGSPTGYAINPVRDLGPRLAYAFILPIKGKGNFNWGYAWVPVVAPMLAAVFTGLLANAIL